MMVAALEEVATILRRYPLSNEDWTKAGELKRDFTAANEQIAALKANNARLSEELEWEIGRNITLKANEAFDRWFNGSKYMQVVYSPDSRQPALDGFLAGRASMKQEAAKVCLDRMDDDNDAPWNDAYELCAETILTIKD
jgi:hypothetical protein